MKHLLFLIFFASQVVSAQGTGNLDLLFQWKDESIEGTWAFDNAYNECWGFVIDGREYAVIGTTEGSHIFDITDIETASEVAFIEAAYTGPGAIHRDYHDYNGHLYIVCDEGPSTLQIVDVSNLPESFEVVYDSDELIRRSHNIFIDSANAVLYSCGGSDQTGGVFLKTLDISNPAEPTTIKSHFETWGYVHDIYVVNNIGYLNCEGRGMYIVSFNLPDTPVVLGSFDAYAGLGYNHSGWLSDDGATYVMCDETHATEVFILDVSNPLDIKVLATVNSGSLQPEAAIAHNAMIKGDYLFVSYYYDGLHVFDLSNPDEPCTAGNWDTSEWEYDYNYRGLWGMYCYLPSGKLLSSDMQEGLFVFEVTDNPAPEVECPIPADWYGPVEEPINVELVNEIGLNINTQIINNQLVINNENGYVGQAQVYGADGRFICEFAIPNGENYIDLPTVASGMYLVNTNLNGWTKTFKIVKP